MLQRFFSVAAFLTVVFCVRASLWAARSELIPETTAARHGLARPWFAQVELNQGQARINDLILFEGVLYVQTNTAMVHAIDAETGKTLWSKQIGRPNHPSMSPDAKGDLLATINGSRLYVVNRFSGDLLYEREMSDTPGNGPGLSTQRVYIPMVTGMMVAYPLKSIVDPARDFDKDGKGDAGLEKTAKETSRQQDVGVGQKYTPPLACQSFGRVLVQPLVTREYAGAEYVVWPTDRGYLNFGRIDREAENALALKFRLQTAAPIVAQPGYLPPDPKVPGDSGVVIGISNDGFVYAINEENGETLWRFSTGEPIVESPAVIEDRVYITTQLGGMYCLEIKTGKSLWWARNITRFVAASKTRVYAVDRIGRVLVLNAANGARLDVIATEKVSMKMANTDTDRIYLVSDGGLIQCLHELEQTEPLVHGKERKLAAKAEANQTEAEAPKPTVPKVDAAKKRKAAGDENDPFGDAGGVGDRAGDENDPFGDAGGVRDRADGDEEAEDDDFPF